MYRIYMPVDLVLAISHNRLVREREWRRQEQEKQQQQQQQQRQQVQKINKESFGIGYYDTIGRDKDKDKDKDNDKNKDKTCLEIFKIW